MKPEAVYNLWIHLNLSVQMIYPKINSPRLFFHYIYILILNNCIESFNKFLFIILNIDPGGKMCNFFKNFN